MGSLYLIQGALRGLRIVRRSYVRFKVAKRTANVKPFRAGEVPICAVPKGGAGGKVSFAG
jgi:hypothetical protein